MPGFLKSGQLVTGSTSLLYKGSDGTGRFLNPDNYQPKGNYALTNHNHTGVYQPVGSYATTTELNEVKTSVSNGKSAVASAITDKGVSTSATASFDTMASNIRSIKTNIYTGLRNDTLPAGYTKVNYIKLNNGALLNTEYTLPKMYYQNETTITNIPKYEWGFTISIDQKGTNDIIGDSNIYHYYCDLLSYFTDGTFSLFLPYGPRYCNTPSNQTLSQKYLGDGWFYNIPTVYRLGTLLNIKYITNQYLNGTFYSGTVLWVNNCNSNAYAPGNTNMNSNRTLGFGQYYGSSYYLKYNPSIYGFYSKLEDTDTYYANMIPCINSSGVAGLYDTVRNIFVSKATDSGTITYG